MFKVLLVAYVGTVAVLASLLCDTLNEEDTEWDAYPVGVKLVASVGGAVIAPVTSTVAVVRELVAS